MEKRALVAALVAGLFLVVWYALFSPKPPTVAPGQETAPAATAGSTPGGTAVPAEETPQAGSAEQPAAPQTGPPAVAASAEEQVTLESGGWTAVVSSKGGVISSLRLKDYKDAEGRPLELVGTRGQPPLAMAAQGPWNTALYKVERDGDAVVLHWSDGRGNWVDKRVWPGPRAYGVEVEVKSGGAPSRGGVVVASGLAPEEQGGEKNRFAVVGGVVRVNGKLEHLNPKKLDTPQTVTGQVDFAGVQDHYFLLVLIPEGRLRDVVATSAGSGDGVVAEVAAVGEDGVVRGTLFAGPKEHQILVAYGHGLQDTLSFGLFGFLSVVFLGALRWIYSWANNWGVAIIVLTAAIRLPLFPLTHKSTVSMRRMQKLQPKMKAIQERYKERAKKDPQVRARMNQEIMGLYKQEGVNPMGGCLPMLVQLPILWALYTLFAYAIELRQAPFMLWIHDLSIKDPTYILPVLMTASMFVQQKLTPQAGDPAQRRMFMMMPLIFGFMFMNFPAGLVLYWLVNNLLTIGQQLVTERIMKNEKPARA